MHDYREPHPPAGQTANSAAQTRGGTMPGAINTPAARQVRCIVSGTYGEATSRCPPLAPATRPQIALHDLI